MMATTQDAFLGGKLEILQPKSGYRAGVDPVLLAAATNAKPRQTVLDLGCGVGTAALCLAARVPDLQITGIELQTDYADLASRNARINAISMRVICADFRNPPKDVLQMRFDHVISNPPFFQTGTTARDHGRATARTESATLEDWICFASKRLNPKGHLTLVQSIARLPDVLSALENRLGSIKVQPLSARSGKPPKLFLLQAKKGGKAEFVLNPTINLHHSAQHQDGPNEYSKPVEAALRHAAPFKVFE